jgi:hypothetical protein
MEVVLRYRGRAVSNTDIQFIRKLIAEHASLSRRGLSAKLCEAWDWRQPNGALKDMVCRGLMLALSRAELIELPALKKHPCNPLARRVRPPSVVVDSSVVEASLRELPPLTFRQVRRTADEARFNSLLEHHHYLNYM